MNCELNGNAKQYIQLGTVMTDEKYRNQGIIRAIINQIKCDYKNADGMFLWANDEVTDFYPKFGFEKADEFRYRRNVSESEDYCAKQINMQTAKDWHNFLEKKSNLKSNGILDMHTDDLLMFYLTQFMQETVYYIENINAYAIAEIENDNLTIFDILSENSINLNAVVKAFGKNIKQVDFAFTPKEVVGLEKYKYHEDDTTFFILGSKLKNDMQKILSFPQLTHA